MAKVRTINGIFKKIGAKEAREFIDGIISLPEHLLEKGDAGAIEEWLVDRELLNGQVVVGCKGGVHVLELVIKEFNEQYE